MPQPPRGFLDHPRPGFGASQSRRKLVATRCVSGLSLDLALGVHLLRLLRRERLVPETPGRKNQPGEGASENPGVFDCCSKKTNKQTMIGGLESLEHQFCVSMFWEISSHLISFVQRGWDHQPEQWLCQCGKTAFDYDVKQAACPSEQVPPGSILVSDQPWKWMSIQKLTHISWQKSKSTKTEMIDPSLVDHIFLIKLAHNWSLHGLTFFQIFWNLARLLASANWLKGESKKESNQFDADVSCFFLEHP